MSEHSTKSDAPSSANEENVAGPFGEPSHQDVAAPVNEQSTASTTGSFRVVVYPGSNEYAKVKVDPKEIEAHEVRQNIRRLLDEA